MCPSSLTAPHLETRTDLSCSHLDGLLGDQRVEESGCFTQRTAGSSPGSHSAFLLLDSTGQEICHQTTASRPTLIPRVHTTWVPGRPESHPVEVPCHAHRAEILSRSLSLQTSGQRRLRAFCLSRRTLGAGGWRAPQKIAFPSLPQRTETLRLRIVPLHPLPFTPAEVFFISLGGRDFPPFSRALPLGSPGPPTTNLRAWAAEQAGPLTCAPDMPLAVFQPQPRRRWLGPRASLSWSGGPGVPAACPRVDCAGPRQRPSI